MFRCSADCCERSADSMSQVHQCIEICHAPLAKAQGLVTNELEQFQVSGHLFVLSIIWHLDGNFDCVYIPSLIAQF